VCLLMYTVCARELGVCSVCDRESIGVVCVGHQFMTCEIHECMATVIGTISAKSEVASYRTLHREQRIILWQKSNQLGFKRKHFQNKFN
jgi:hypothetical protein